VEVLQQQSILRSALASYTDEFALHGMSSTNLIRKQPALPLREIGDKERDVITANRRRRKEAQDSGAS
jgi:hypothetical protein